jgi:iron complex transport system ATP-binding protein
MADTEPALKTVVSGKHAEIDLWRPITRTDRREAREILRQIECLHLAGRPWSVLSQGERQRILIGRALMARPALLILDEPCAGLDPVAREHFLTWINHLGTKPGSPTLVLVTHHVEEITPVFSHALLLKQGATVASGPIRSTMTSAALAATFNARVTLRKKDGRYALRVEAGQEDIVV